MARPTANSRPSGLNEGPLPAAARSDALEELAGVLSHTAAIPSARSVPSSVPVGA